MPQVQAAGDLAAAFAGVEAARQQVVAANAVAEHDDTYPIDTPPGQTEPAKRPGAAWSAPSPSSRRDSPTCGRWRPPPPPVRGPTSQALDDEFAAYRSRPRRSRRRARARQRHARRAVYLTEAIEAATPAASRRPSPR